MKAHIPEAVLRISQFVQTDNTSVPEFEQLPWETRHLSPYLSIAAIIESGRCLPVRGTVLPTARCRVGAIGNNPGEHVGGGSIQGAYR